MIPKAKITFEELQTIRSACLENATDLIASAKALLETGVTHIAYHLAVLALEEIGKLSLIQTQFIFIQRDQEPNFIPDLESHTKKLFWALWGMFFGLGSNAKSSFDFQKGLSKSLHENRLDYLYVDVNNPVSQKSKVSRKEVEKLIEMTDARLKHESTNEIKKSTPEIDDLTRWFILASEDPEKRSFIFSQESFLMMRQKKNAREWIQWIKDKYEAARAEMEEVLRIERERELPDRSDFVPKWRINVQFVSESNTIRPGFLSAWNSTSEEITVSAGKTKKHLVCQFILPDTVSVDDVFAKGWTFAKVFAVAINIATLGYFWWYIPSDTYQYSQSIVDINNPKIQLKATEMDYGMKWEQRALTADDVFNIKLIMAYMVRIHEKPEETALDSYFQGINLIGKSDAHLQFQLNAFEALFRALVIGMKFSGIWKEGEDFEESVFKFLGEGVTEVEELQRLIRLGLRLNEFKQTGTSEIKMKDVADLKSYCDAFFLFRAAELVRDSVLEELKTKASSSE